MPNFESAVPGVALKRLSLLVAALSMAFLSACGGGGGDGGSGAVAAAPTSAQSSVALAADAPQVTGNTATDGLAWFNYRRQQMGLTAVTRNALLDIGAQGHSEYQKLNNTITHNQSPGTPGYTGATLGQRIAASGYVFTQSRYAYGEVISATGDPSGFTAAEDLIGAIYHRFVIFDPMFREAGVGSASVQSGYTYFTTNFAANGLGPGIGNGNLAVYPPSGQQNVPVNFFSDRETPDPVPNQNEVGYPVSVHADITGTVAVTSFTIRPRGGVPLSARLLSRATDPTETPQSAASIVPLAVLTAATTYDVEFTGTVDGVAVSRNWSFRTR